MLIILKNIVKEDFVNYPIPKEVEFSRILFNLEIHTEDDNDNMIEYLEQLTDRFEEGERELETLIDYITKAIVSFEEVHYPIGETTPEGMLAFLMDQNNHKQKDMADVATQSVISEILSGKRQLGKNHIEKLSQKYNVSPALFFTV